MTKCLYSCLKLFFINNHTNDILTESKRIANTYYVL